VYESSCDDFICLYENPTNPAFFAEEGKEYTIAILDVNELLIDEFELTISCNYFEVADPCVCNNDQFSSLENIGSFNETVTINNTTASEIWTVIAIDSENGDIKPSNIEIGDKLSFDQINFDHKIEFVHYDNFGYTITVEGPSELGHINNFATSLSNVCSYPEKFPITDELFVFIEDTIQAEEILTEINDHYGYAIESQNQVHLFPIPASEIGPGVHNVILQTSDSNGCLTEQELIIIVETEVSIPTLGEWGLVCLGLLFLIFGITCIREFGYENTVHTD